MSELVLIDTSTWICFFARKGFNEVKKVVSLLLDDDRAAISGPVLLELVQGVRTEKEKGDIQDLIKGLHWLTVSDTHWHKAADLAFKMRRKGVTTSGVDTIIATLAIEYECLLLHRDSDYEMIAKHSSLRCYKYI
ncbi:MAG: PIN domain-containing protein [Nitrospinae bacterium]|nr:PIN domain-containing protein [Nitrospinota bacterium]